MNILTIRDQITLAGNRIEGFAQEVLDLRNKS